MEQDSKAPLRAALRSDVTVPQSEHHTARALKACTHCQGQSCYHTDYNALNDMLAQLCSVPVQRMKSTIKCTRTQKLGFYMQEESYFVKVIFE